MDLVKFVHPSVEYQLTLLADTRSTYRPTPGHSLGQHWSADMLSNNQLSQPSCRATDLLIDCVGWYVDHHRYAANTSLNT